MSWAELVVSGITFKLNGLGDGQSCQSSAADTLIDIASTYLLDRSETLCLSLGDHVRSGGKSTAIIRVMIECARIIVSAFPNCIGVSWESARIVASPKFFLAQAQEWDNKGQFPIRFFVIIRPSIDEGIESRGLELFTGQELRIEPEIVHAMPDVNLLSERLAVTLALHGGLDAIQTYTAPDGTTLKLEPSVNGRYVRVWRA